MLNKFGFMLPINNCLFAVMCLMYQPVRSVQRGSCDFIYFHDIVHPFVVRTKQRSENGTNVMWRGIVKWLCKEMEKEASTMDTLKESSGRGQPTPKSSASRKMQMTIGVSKPKSRYRFVHTIIRRQWYGFNCSIPQSLRWGMSSTPGSWPNWDRE